MTKEMKDLKKKIEKLDNEIVRTKVRLNRAIKSCEYMQEENPDFAKYNFSSQVARENVGYFQEYLKDLEKEKQDNVSLFCDLAIKQEQEVLSDTSNLSNTSYPTTERKFRLKQRCDDLDALIFAYNCMVKTAQAKINIALEDEGVVTAEIIKDQENLTCLQNKHALMIARQNQVREVLQNGQSTVDEKEL